MRPATGVDCRLFLKEQRVCWNIVFLWPPFSLLVQISTRSGEMKLSSLNFLLNYSWCRPCLKVSITVTICNTFPLLASSRFVFYYYWYCQPSHTICQWNIWNGKRILRTFWIRTIFLKTSFGCFGDIISSSFCSTPKSIQI